MWDKDKPTEEGWYFWRKTKVQSDPWKWNTYYLIPNEAECWENGTEVFWPKGGQWQAINKANHP